MTIHDEYEKTRQHGNRIIRSSGGREQRERSWTGCREIRKEKDEIKRGERKEGNIRE